MKPKNGQHELVASVTENMEEEEMRLQEERAKQELKEAARDAGQPPVQLGQSSFKTLEQLLSRAELYSQFLLEKMEDPAQVSFDSACTP